MRIWAASSDFTGKICALDEILKANVETYRKLRNTMRYILANLKDWKESERVAVKDMPELERFILHRLSRTRPRQCAPATRRSTSSAS
jgi:isoleucyl-tRNA synthetase